MDTPKKIRTDFLSPAVAVSLAWGLTHSSSSDENSRTIDAQKVRDSIRNIKEKADGAGDPERRYVMGVEALIEAWFRNLVMIINDRNKNFDQVAEMRETQVKNIQYYSKFSSDLQSLIPRLSSMTIGGVTVAVLFGDLLGNMFPVLGAYALPLLLAGGSAVGYFVNGFVVTPIVNGSLHKQIIKKDFQRNRYYNQFVARSRKVLVSLYGCGGRLAQRGFRKEL